MAAPPATATATAIQIINGACQEFIDTVPIGWEHRAEMETIVFPYMDVPLLPDEFNMQVIRPVLEYLNCVTEEQAAEWGDAACATLMDAHKALVAQAARRLGSEHQRLARELADSEFGLRRQDDNVFVVNDFLIRFTLPEGYPFKAPKIEYMTARGWMDYTYNPAMFSPSMTMEQMALTVQVDVEPERQALAAAAEPEPESKPESKSESKPVSYAILGYTPGESFRFKVEHDDDSVHEVEQPWLDDYRGVSSQHWFCGETGEMVLLDIPTRPFTVVEGKLYQRATQMQFDYWSTLEHADGVDHTRTDNARMYRAIMGIPEPEPERVRA